MSTTRKTPKLRFPEFTDDWEQRKLGDLAEIVGGGTPSTSKDEYWDGEIDWYAPAEIANQIYVESSERKITSEGLNNSSAKMLPVGTVLFTSRAGIGKMAILRKEACTNQGFQSIVPHVNELDSYFIFSRSEELKRYGETVGAGSTFVEVSGKQMSAMPLMMPPTIDEQRKIGEYFSSLDNLITLHQRELDSLKKLKKSLLQKMFPKNGEKIPELRFPEFTGDWEQRKFKDVGTVSMCKRIFKEETSEEGDIPFFKIGTFGGIPDAFISRELFDEYKSKYSYPEPGDILLSASGTIGRIVEYEGEEAYFQDSNIVWLSHDKSVDNKFLKVLYSIVKWDGIEGSTIKRLYNDNFLKTQFMLPSIEEQKKIGSFFEQLDNLITLHQRELDTLKKLKKGLLQNMFV